MKSLKHKILRHHFYIIIMLPVFICLLFNITIQLYSYNGAKSELERVADNVNKVFKMVNETDYNVFSKPHSNRTELSSFDIIRSSMQVSQHYSNTDFFIYSNSTVISSLNPRDTSQTFLTDDLIEQTLFHLENSKPNEIITFRDNFIYYHATYRDISDVRMIYISTGHYTDNLVQTVNTALIVICLISAFIALLGANKMARGITDPIKELSSKVKSFKSGDEITIDADFNCREIFDLKNSINTMSKRLLEYDISQKSFLLNASHELRTPLMSISGYAEGIEKEIFDNPLEMAKIISEESKRLNFLVDKLLTLSRIENNTLSENVEMLNLSDIIKDYVLKVRGYAIKEEITVNLNVLNNDLYAFVDDSALTQAVINILSNSIRHAKTCVNIELFKRDFDIIIRIHDDGQGIDLNDLPYIFDRFYKGKNGNLGLGLSISKTAIEYMNGSLKAFNLDGAVFEISIPSSK